MEYGKTRGIASTHTDERHDMTQPHLTAHTAQDQAHHSARARYLWRTVVLNSSGGAPSWPQKAEFDDFSFFRQSLDYENTHTAEDRASRGARRGKNQTIRLIRVVVPLVRRPAESVPHLLGEFFFVFFDL